MSRSSRTASTNLSEEIKAKLGQPYFRNIRFSLGPVELPGVQKAIDAAQSAFAEVSRAQARVAQAKADADANRERQRGYNACRPASASTPSRRFRPV